MNAVTYNGIIIEEAPVLGHLALHKWSSLTVLNHFSKSLILSK